MQTGMANDDRCNEGRVHAFLGERMIVVSDEHTGFMHLLVYERLS